MKGIERGAVVAAVGNRKQRQKGSLNPGCDEITCSSFARVMKCDRCVPAHNPENIYIRNQGSLLKTPRMPSRIDHNFSNMTAATKPRLHQLKDLEIIQNATYRAHNQAN